MSRLLAESEYLAAHAPARARDKRGTRNKGYRIFFGKDRDGNPYVVRSDGLTDEQRADEVERRKMAEDLDTLYRRSEAGIAWLKEHDPDSSFHLWFQSRITPGSPMPAVSEERALAYREYHRARVLWERIEERIADIEKKRGEGVF